MKINKQPWFLERFSSRLQSTAVPLLAGHLVPDGFVTGESVGVGLEWVGIELEWVGIKLEWVGIGRWGWNGWDWAGMGGY